jgi:hypothetical protein
LSFVGLESQQTAILCDAALEKKNLRHIDVSDNMIGRESGDAISTFIRRSQYIRYFLSLPSTNDCQEFEPLKEPFMGLRSEYSFSLA